MEETEKKMETQDTKVEDNSTINLIDALKKELSEDENKKAEEQQKKLEELEKKSYSKDEVKEVLKTLMKDQKESSSSVEQTKEQLESQLQEMKEKLDKMSGSKVQTEVEEKPFEAPKTETSSNTEVELTDEWVLKKKGLM